MPFLEDFLARFRRVWAAPGAVAGQSAVPVDPEARLDDELRDLTSALSAIAELGRSIVEAAEKEAAGIIAAARAESERTIQTARSRLPEVRAIRAAMRIRDRTGDIDQLIGAAEGQAMELRERARSRMPGVVSRAVSGVFADTAGPVEEEHARVVGGG